ncbi:MAG: ABC transporter ATP-binding protein [Coriobacteriia bacterium]|nr:ABC transporter ATP-binding protein [Coriobacteriia bacterium]
MAVIETKDLTKYYGKTRGIENLNLAVEEGEIFGFIGPNGAGKSTTIRTLLNLIFPTSGSAMIFGLDVVKDKVKILKDVGYLPSEVFYYDGMRAIDLLTYSASFYRVDAKPRIKELADRLDLDLHKKIDDLSYGNRKKVGIIQGLLHSPKLIILDEPTGGLDPLMQQTFFQIIREQNQAGATVLFSSHILSEVQKMASRIAIIKDGNIIKTETMAEMQKESYKKVILTFKTPEEAKAFTLAGSDGVEVHDNTFNCIYRGDIHLLVTAIAASAAIDVHIAEPDLEEVFMHYYRSDGPNATDNVSAAPASHKKVAA